MTGVPGENDLGIWGVCLKTNFWHTQGKDASEKLIEKGYAELNMEAPDWILFSRIYTKWKRTYFKEEGFLKESKTKNNLDY